MTNEPDLDVGRASLRATDCTVSARGEAHPTVRVLMFLLAAFAVNVCATAARPSGEANVAAPGNGRPPTEIINRSFDFAKDTFSFANGLLWIYEYDANGKWITRPRLPKPEYWQHCMLMAQATKQFYYNVRFEPNQPLADRQTYRKLIRRVIKSNARRTLPETKRIVIPGYRNLREFSKEQEALIKEALGGGWRSYFQRGHWRVVFPFSRSGQGRMAARLYGELQSHQPLVVHLVRFPQLSINHAVIFFDSQEDDREIRFSLYDPNLPSVPRMITYNKAKRTFYFPANNYWPGGRVDVYEIYRGLLY